MYIDIQSNDAGYVLLEHALTAQLVDLYVPRKCAATNRLIKAHDHASVQINIADVDESGRMLNTQTSFALCGFVREKGKFLFVMVVDAIEAAMMVLVFTINTN